MALVAFLFRATLILWGVAILTAIAGFAFDQEWLTAISLGFRRIAPAVTLIWLVTALGRMLLVRLWPGNRRPRR